MASFGEQVERIDRAIAKEDLTPAQVTPRATIGAATPRPIEDLERALSTSRSRASRRRPSRLLEQRARDAAEAELDRGVRPMGPAPTTITARPAAAPRARPGGYGNTGFLLPSCTVASDF